jgi:hypothetical protein
MGKLMELEKWALIAEIVSGLAVAVTLVILFFGVRQDTATLIVAAAATSRDNLASIGDQALALSEDNFALLVRSIEPTTKWEDLTAAEQFWLRTFQRAFLQRAEAQYFRFRNGLLENDAWQTVRFRVWTNVNIPAWREIWRNDRSNVYTSGFVEAVESCQPPEGAGR